MKHTTLSAEEIADLDETKTKEARGNGYRLMPTRDRGYARLNNGVSVRWHSDSPRYDESGVRPALPPKGDFVIEAGDSTIIFNAEELRRYLRWA